MERYIMIRMIRKLNETNRKIAYLRGFLAGRNVDDEIAIEIADDIADDIEELIVDLYDEEDKEHARAEKDDPAQS